MFQNFLNSLKNEYNKNLIESIIDGYKICFETNEQANINKVKSFKTEEGNFDVYDEEKDINLRRRGDMFTVLKDKKGWIIRNALLPEEMRKQGIGTEFYIRMNKESMKHTGKPLRSTQPRKLTNEEIVHELSPAGISLWDSLVRKGYAEKLGEKDYRFKV